MDLNWTLPSTGFVRISTVLKHFPVSESYWWENVKNGVFPQPVKLSPRITVWRAEDIHALIAEYAEDFIETASAPILDCGGEDDKK